MHTTKSDGEFTPSQVATLAQQAGLAAIAITDHDTCAAVDEVRAAAPEQLEVIAGVEISAEFADREVHVLGYFVRTNHAELNAALSRVCIRRRERFHDYVSKLANRGHTLPAERVKSLADATPSLGRRHIASLLVECRIAHNRTEAFHRFLGPLREQVMPKVLVPVEEAIHLVHAAGGVASLAHPSAELDDAAFRTLAGYRLDAIEVEYPWGRNSRTSKLRDVAERFGFAVSGGSDCHGPDPSHRRIGSHGINLEEFETLRSRAAAVHSTPGNAPPSMSKL
ncbi:MAG: PHP domain-containing protein [Planctomycetes bacterium]|nr:PHP domain-containing protein [Planctomycetota bacterium]